MDSAAAFVKPNGHLASQKQLLNPLKVVSSLFRGFLKTPNETGIIEFQDLLPTQFPWTENTIRILKELSILKLQLSSDILDALFNRLEEYADTFASVLLFWVVLSTLITKFEHQVRRTFYEKVMSLAWTFCGETETYCEQMRDLHEAKYSAKTFQYKIVTHGFLSDFIMESSWCCRKVTEEGSSENDLASVCATSRGSSISCIPSRIVLSKNKK